MQLRPRSPHQRSHVSHGPSKQQVLSSLLALQCTLAWSAPNNIVQPLPGTDGGAILRGIEQQMPPLRQTLPTPSLPEPSSPPASKIEEELKVTVKGFEFVGNTLISDDELHELLDDNVGKELSIGEIQKAADKIATLYQSLGIWPT